MLTTCILGLEWSWQDWECKSPIADSNLVIPEVLDRQMRYSSSYRDYNYDKIYDDVRDGCGEVSFAKIRFGHLLGHI